jgi:hypothetical protein
VSTSIKDYTEIREALPFQNPHECHFRDIKQYDFWLFGMLKRIVKDSGLKSNDDIREVWTKVLDDFTFDSMQSIFQNWRSRLAKVIENVGGYTYE